MNQVDIWSLIKTGNFKEACNRADLEYTETQNILLLRNKVYALFHLEMYAEALELLKKIITIEHLQSDGDYIFSGIAYWLLDKKKEAITIWQEGEKCIYTDAAGGMELQLYLYFAAVYINDDNLKAKTRKVIKKIAKSKTAINYPGPLGLYLLGELTEIQLFSYVSSVPILRERQLCQADFTIAIKSLEEGKEQEYKNKLKDSISHGSSSFLSKMYYLAKGELSNQQKK